MSMRNTPHFLVHRLRSLMLKTTPRAPTRRSPLCDVGQQLLSLPKWVPPMSRRTANYHLDSKCWRSQRDECANTYMIEVAM